MIISKTPLRMSFLGGGSDIPAFYRKHGGLVVSTSIDKYVFVTVNRKFDGRVRVSYSVTEEVASAKDVKHPLVRTALEVTGINEGLEMTSISDIPASGTGLGSSSSFTVGLLNALNAFKGQHSHPEDIARDACMIEIDMCGAPIGKQDQYAAAYGGFNIIEFRPDESVQVTPIVAQPERYQAFQGQLQCFYTNRTRSANSILQEQTSRSASNADTVAHLLALKQLAITFVDAFRDGDLDAMGAILHEGWERKRQLSTGISDGEIDHYYELARRAGASGGKLLGAGGGGFLLIQTPTDRQEAVRRALSNLREVAMPFSREGSRIIFYQPNLAA